MNRIVAIPNVGKVAFPDHMTDAEVSQAAARLHAKSNPQSQAPPPQPGPPGPQPERAQSPPGPQSSPTPATSAPAVQPEPKPSADPLTDFILGDEALKNASLSEKAKHLGDVGKIIERSPRLAQAIHAAAYSSARMPARPPQKQQWTPAPDDPVLHIQTSDGKRYELHADDLEKAKQKDPGLKVLQ